MPIDTSMYGDLRPVQVPDPMESYGRALSLKALMDRGRMNDIAVQEHEQKLREQKQDEADDEIVRNAFGELKGDIGKLPDKVAGKVSQKRQLAIIKQVDDWRKENQALGEGELKNRKAQAERFGSIAGSVKDEPSLRRAVGTALAEKLITPEQAAEWNARPWDDDTKAAIAQIAQQGMSVAEIHSAGIRDLESQRAGQKHEAELPGVKAKTAEGVRENAAAQLGAATSAEDYKRIWDELPAGVARSFPAPEQWSPQTSATVRQAGMTPAQQATQTGSEAARTETARHNKAMETRQPQGTPRTPEGLTVGEEKRRFDTAMSEQEKLQAEEQQQHRARIALGRTIRMHDWKDEAKKEARSTGEEFIGADGVKYTAGPDTKRALETKLEGITKKVAELQTRQNKIRLQFKVGEFQKPSTKVDTGSKPGAQPASSAGGERIRVKLADGRTGTIYSRQFDPKTMTKL